MTIIDQKDSATARGMVELADQIEKARHAFLDAFRAGGRSPEAAQARIVLEQLLWDDKSTIISALRQAASPDAEAPGANPKDLISCLAKSEHRDQWSMAQFAPGPDAVVQEALDKLKKQAIVAADGIDLLQDSRSLRRRTAEILRELVAALSPAVAEMDGRAITDAMVEAGASGLLTALVNGTQLHDFAWIKQPGEVKEHWLRCARACLTAALSQAQGPGEPVTRPERSPAK